MDISIKEEILNKLKEVRSFHKTSIDQYAMRCPICGDSKKDLSKTRFYLKINTNDESPILYNCFNCNSSGVLKPDILRMMDIYDSTLNSKLITFNKCSSKSIQRRIGIKNEKLNVIVPVPKYTKRNMIKKKYIEDRLGLELTFDELRNLKCIFSLKEFVELNHIETLSVSVNRAQLLNDEYVGFLTTNNEFINFRDITNKNKLRYDKYTIIPDLLDTVKTYTIPTSIPILTTEPITINIAEGVFDILGIYYHIMNQNTHNTIYTAVCGSGYMNVIKYFIRLGIIGKNVNINIFSDSDIDMYFYNKVIAYSKQWFGKINIIYNTKEKDYGVHKDKINLSIHKY